MRERDALDVLVQDGFIRHDVTRFRTTPRWQAALARAAFHLQRSGAPWQDLRLPIAAALADQYRDRPDDELASLVEAILPIEMAELAPLLGTTASAGR
jgi:hypothetical protein